MLQPEMQPFCKCSCALACHFYGDRVFGIDSLGFGGVSRVLVLSEAVGGTAAPLTGPAPGLDRGTGACTVPDRCADHAV